MSTLLYSCAGRRPHGFVASLVLGALLSAAWAAAQFPLPTTQPAASGLAGSKHDFSRADWSPGDLCSACHTPHRERPPAAAPLWDADADLSRRFGNAAAGDARVGEGTRMCMRCHDGTVAKDTLGGVRQPRSPYTRHPGLFTAGHGGSDHPVAVAYPDFDRGYHPPSTVDAEGVVPVPHGRVECSSCHDPHNASGEDYMLVTSNDRSALCLACHIK
jgi:predicted CXXCH cytochrome family protein